MIRAAEWLATGKASYTLPDKFPTEDSICLVAEWYNYSSVLNYAKNEWVMKIDSI